MSETHVTGLKELYALLQTLPVNIEKNLMRGALRQGMKPVKAQAQANIHSRSGKLAESLSIKSNARSGTVRGILRAGKGFDSYKAMWVEFGTRPHYITVQDNERIHGRQNIVSMTTINRVDRALKIGLNFVGPSVHHPGSGPHPFMRPALDSQASAAVMAAGNYLKTKMATKQGLYTADISIGDEP